MKMKTLLTTVFTSAVLLALTPSGASAQTSAPADSTVKKEAPVKHKETRQEKRARKEALKLAEEKRERAQQDSIAAAIKYQQDSIANAAYQKMNRAFENFGLEILGEETPVGASERTFIAAKDVRSGGKSLGVKFFEASYTPEKGAYNIRELSKPASPDETWRGVFTSAEKVFNNLGYTPLVGEKELIGCCDKGAVYVLKKTDASLDEGVYMAEYVSSGNTVTRMVKLQKPCAPIVNKALTMPK